MTTERRREHVETLVIGGGQAGLCVGYYLAQHGRPFVIVDANACVGDSWRNRWDSLHLFTPNRFNSLPGMPFPGDDWGFPSKDDVADYLEAYAARFELPIRNRVRVEGLTRPGQCFVATTGNGELEADNVIIAMATWQRPRPPDFAAELNHDTVQLHVHDYKNPDQVRPGDVLVVGAGNSGAEIAMELAGTHRVWLSGPDTGHLPFRPASRAGRVLMPLVGRIVLHRVLTTSTPMGRKARPKKLASGEPLLRVKPKDLAAAGVTRVPRTVGIEDGSPLLEDGRTLDVANVIWCTGFEPGFDWIDLPVFGDSGPIHERGVVTTEPGLYFVGLKFLYAATSSSLLGVRRDAAYVADAIRESRAAGAGPRHDSAAPPRVR